MLQGLGAQRIKLIADGFATERDSQGHPIPNATSETVRSALQALAGCAGSAAGGSGDCGSAAMGAAASVVLNNLLSTGATPATDKDGKPLTGEEQQARENLVASLVTAIASGAGLDANAASTAARIETTNNAFTTPLGYFGPDNPKGLTTKEVYEHDPAFRESVDKLGGLDAFEVVVACADQPTVCKPTPEQEAAFDAYVRADRRLEAAEKAGGGAAGQAGQSLCGGDGLLLCGLRQIEAFSQTPTGVRLSGAAQAIGGGMEMAVGAAAAVGGAATCPESLGLGCGVALGGVASVIMGVDNYQTGLHMLWSGAPTSTIGAQVISNVSGLSPSQSEWAYTGVNLVVGLGTGALGSASKAGSSAAAEGSVSNSGIWNLSPTDRGITIESQLAKTEYGPYNGWYHVGAENNGYFPLVDFQNGNTLVSLKTVDTTGTTWLPRMRDVIDELASSKATVNGNSANMVLDMRVQPGGSSAAQSLIDYGKSRNITVIIKEYP